MQTWEIYPRASSPHWTRNCLPWSSHLPGYPPGGLAAHALCLAYIIVTSWTHLKRVKIQNEWTSISGDLADHPSVQTPSARERTSRTEDEISRGFCAARKVSCTYLKLEPALMVQYNTISMIPGGWNSSGFVQICPSGAGVRPGKDVGGDSPGGRLLPRRSHPT